MDNSEHLLSTADQYFAQDRYRQAKRIYESLCDDESIRFRAIAGLAKVNLIQGHFYDALNLAQRGLDLQPNDLALLRIQALALHKNKEWDRAKIIYERIIAEYPADAVALAGYSMSLFEMGRAQQAQELAEKALALDDRERVAWLSLAYSLARQDGKFMQSLRTARQIGPGFGAWEAYSALIDVFRVKYPWLVAVLTAGCLAISLWIRSLFTLPIFLLALTLMGTPAYGYWRTKRKRAALLIAAFVTFVIILYASTQFGVL